MGHVWRILARTLAEIARERLHPGRGSSADDADSIDTDWSAVDYTLLGWIALHHRRGVTLGDLARYLDRDRRDVEQRVYRLYATDHVEFTDDLRVRLARDW